MSSDQFTSFKIEDSLPEDDVKVVILVEFTSYQKEKTLSHHFAKFSRSGGWKIVNKRHDVYRVISWCYLPEDMECEFDGC